MNNQTPHGPPAYDRELEEQHHRQRLMQDDLAQREREHNERQERERQQREQFQQVPPHQNNTGSIPIHQPVASRVPGAIHSPGGLLANHGGTLPSGPLGAPSGPGNAFGGPLHSDANRAMPHNNTNAAGLSAHHQSFASLLNHTGNASGAGMNNAGSGGVGFGGLPQQQLQQQQQLPFAVPMAATHQIAGPAALGQGGQQPILNVSPFS